MQFLSKTAIHTSGKGPSLIYRIPGIIVTARDTILTCCEGRSGQSDWSGEAIVSRRSEDGGLSWSEERCLVSGLGESVNNPVMIAGNDGLVHFLWQTRYRRTFYQRGLDDGRSFSPPREITRVFDTYRTRDGIRWNVYALGPGHGIQTGGGRLVQPVWISFGEGDSHGPAVVSSIYSEDNGETWQAGEVIPWDDRCPNMNETTAAELSDGRVLFNIRNHSPEFLRAVSVSPDGFSRFSPCRLDPALPDPICFGSLAAASIEGKHTLLFSNCGVRPCRENFYSRARRNLTVRLSRDDGETWPVSRRLEIGAGYSDMAVSRDGKWFYCYYEHDCSDILHSEPRHLTLAKFNLEWLED